MIEKRYANDSAKSAARALYKNMLEKHVLSKRKPKNTRVLCFLGVDATELKEVYEPLGIPPENVICPERDSRVYSELESKKLGANLIPESVEEYLDSQKNISFDSIFLDYIGPVSRNQFLTLKKIAEKQTRNEFLLHTTNLIRRDSRSQALYNLGYGVIPDFNESGEEIMEAILLGKQTKKMIDRVQSLERRRDKNESLQNEKMLAYSVLMCSPFLRNTGKGIMEACRFITGQYYEELVRGYISSAKESGVQFDRKMFEDPKHMPSYGFKLLEDISMRFLQSRLSQEGLNMNLLPIVARAFNDSFKEEKFYLQKDIATYSYVSESGAPMIGDISFLQYPQNIALHAKRVVGLMGYPRKFEIKDLTNFIDATIRYGKECNRFCSSYELDELSNKVRNRQFLGSSARPLLTRKRAIEEFQSGASVNDVREKYRGWRNKPLSQWKAHVTMGSYNEVLDGNGDVDEISKEEALDLLVANIPPEEIHSAYPTSFGVGTLRAYKAHLTMGSYRE